MKTKEFFTSDLHFLHKRIVEFTDRKQVTTQENHTEWLIDIWNKRVNKNDTVWHLGDFCFSYNYSDWQEILERLNGNKFFLKGNHDASRVLTKIKGITYYDYKCIQRDVYTLCLFHYPIASWDKQRYGSFHLHGHSHGNYTAEGKILDVGLDSGFKIFGEHKLFEFDEIVEIMKTKEIYCADSHRDACEM